MIRLALVGAGLVGKRHAEAIQAATGVSLSAIVDPNEPGRAFADAEGVPWFRNLEEMFAAGAPNGVILATPTLLHVDLGLDCIVRRCPVLIEKPLASSSDEAEILVTRAEQSGVPVLVGHHRRHNPLVQRARQAIDEGVIGDIRALHAVCWLYKPDAYFTEAPWRTKAGAGPILVNLVHDVDLIRYLCGDVISVQAQAAPSSRGHENEDVAAAVLRFANGAIGTITVSDTIAAPWSWEMTARENPVYPPTSQACYQIGGTDGALSIPNLTLWKYEGEKSWWAPISASSLTRETSDPLINQIAHFAEVIDGRAPPLVSAREGLKSLRVVEAIQKSAATQETIFLSGAPENAHVAE